MTPATPELEKVINEGPTCLRLKVKGTKAKHGYLARYGLNSAPPLTIKYFSSTRDLLLTDLTSGGTYSISVAALGGGNLMSPWTQPVTCVCT